MSILASAFARLNGSAIAPRWHMHLCAAFAVLVFGASGCGESKNTVSVNGRVTYRGDALPNGSLMLFPSSGRPVTVSLSEDGSYSADLEPGEYVVTVGYSEPLPPGFKEGDVLPPTKINMLPEYTLRAKSTLTATVTPDQSEPINFDLK